MLFLSLPATCAICINFISNLCIRNQARKYKKYGKILVRHNYNKIIANSIYFTYYLLYVENCVATIGEVRFSAQLVWAKHFYSMRRSRYEKGNQFGIIGDAGN